MKKPLFFLFILFFLSLGCSERSATVRNGEIRNVDAPKAYQMIQNNSGKSGLVIIDVRSPEEFAEGHIAGAVNLDINSPVFSAELNKMDRDKTYLVYCRAGSRSARAYLIMEKMGFNNTYNLFGGFLEWKDEGLPSEN